MQTTDSPRLFADCIPFYSHSSTCNLQIHDSSSSVCLPSQDREHPEGRGWAELTSELLMPTSNSLNRFNKQASFQKFWKHQHPALAEKRMNPQREKGCQEWRVPGLVEIVHSVAFYISDWKEYFASQLSPDSHEELVIQASLPGFWI